MSKPTTREEFKQYCLRKLGAPVINIDLADEQIEDRIDEAISFWNDYYQDGSELMYLKHQLTQEDIDNQYIDVPEELIGVTRIFDMYSSISTGTGMFNVVYQYVLNNTSDLTGYSIDSYWMTMQNLRFMQEWLVGLPMIRYNRHTNRVYLDMAQSRMAAGDWLIVEAYAPLSETASDMWQDRWLQNYCIVLIQESWGRVLTKFINGQLVGGMQFNGELILQEAKEERLRLEDEAKNNLVFLQHFSG